MPTHDDEVRTTYPGGDAHRRLDRIERRLDSITTLLERMARIEERQLQHDTNSLEGMQRLGGRYDELIKRVEQMEVADAHSAIVVKWIQMVFWLIISGAMVIIGRHIFLLSSTH